MNHRNVPAVTEAVEKLIYFNFINEYHSGKQLPTEKELTRELNITRTTLRSALEILECEHIIERTPNMSPKTSQSKYSIGLFEGDNFMNALRKADSNFQTDLISFNSSSPNKSIINLLNLSENQDVYQIYRLRKIDFLPTSIETININKSLTPNLDIHYNYKRSLSFTLKNIYHYNLRVRSISFSVGFANPTEAKLLRIKSNDPLIIIKGVKFLEDGTPLQTFKQLYRADKFKLTSYKY
ncbi:GntR family transcriptional regulator [Facklamia languida]|uniref:HTH gntR-type domain-containing protein n=1 Tax=Facklamia languida CCUG 37842 TaxID=883113 RepID=H3NIG4_9LACT|nr:GntR family transcriptional regulator [Facklamia languida]EHR37474.1 hypothetical protein HMPREF9708_00653 [Facklamia languida CCUG 37842]